MGCPALDTAMENLGEQLNPKQAPAGSNTAGTIFSKRLPLNKFIGKNFT